MSDTLIAPTVAHSTFVLERSYAATPEHVFSAFADPAKKRRWYADARTHAVDDYTMDFRVGGTDVGRFTFREGTPFPGTSFENVNTYLDIVPNRRIVMAYAMSMAGHRFSASLATIELLPTEKGTDLIFTEQSAFFEGADGAAIRKEGWSKLLDALAVELNS